MLHLIVHSGDKGMEPCVDLDAAAESKYCPTLYRVLKSVPCPEATSIYPTNQGEELGWLWQSFLGRLVQLLNYCNEGL